MEGFPLSTEFLNGLGVVGLSVLVLLLVIFGKGLTLQSRVKDRDDIIARQDETIEWLRQANSNKDAQIFDLTQAVQVSAMGFQKVGIAAEQIAGGERT